MWKKEREGEKEKEKKGVGKKLLKTVKMREL